LKRNIPSLVAKAAFVALLLGGVAEAQTASGSSVLYRLNTDSSFQRGCFPPCECPIMIGEPVKGTFLLTPTGFDGLFSNYSVTVVNWNVSINGIATVVTGTGTYKIGGEVALQQELSLDLQMDGGSVEHFESGLVPDPVVFPDIEVSISTNRQFCFDTVFNVNASPMPLPQLHIGFGNTNTVVLSWEVAAAPFVLQECFDLAKSNWTIVTNTPTVIGQQNQVVLPRSSGNRCFRLQPAGN